MGTAGVIAEVGAGILRVGQCVIFHPIVWRLWEVHCFVGVGACSGIGRDGGTTFGRYLASGCGLLVRLSVSLCVARRRARDIRLCRC
jgi:hypothetical protein